MAKFLIISGDHERHLFVERVNDIFDDVLVVCMRREPTLPVCPDGYSLTDQETSKNILKIGLMSNTVNLVCLNLHLFFLVVILFLLTRKTYPELRLT